MEMQSAGASTEEIKVVETEERNAEAEIITIEKVIVVAETEDQEAEVLGQRMLVRVPQG